MIEMLWVLAILLVTVTGTCAPFSAMSGAVIVMSLLGIAPATPSDFSASAVTLESKPLLFQTAPNALLILITPVAVVSKVALANLRNVLRSWFMHLSTGD